MRRIAIVVALLAFAGWAGSTFLSERGGPPHGDRLIAEDDRGAPQDRRASSEGSFSEHESFTLPRNADVPTLVEFIRQLRQEPPQPGPAGDELAERAAVAIRDACERILRQDKDPNSADSQFAQRELISLDIEQLPEVNEPALRQAAFVKLRDAILARPVTLADAELALDLLAMGEDVERPDFIRPHAEQLAKHYESSLDLDVQTRVRMLRGMARRLGLVGQSLAFKGTTVTGEPFELSQWKGKVVVVDFWADWSQDKLDEWSNLKRNYRAYHDRGLEIVSIHLGETRDQMELSLLRQRVPWLTLYDDQQRAHHPVAVDLGIVSLPRRLLIDQQGKVVSIDVRGRNLRRHLRKLLGAPDAPLAGRFGFPAFNSGEVIERLCDAGEEMLAQGGFTAATSLRPGLAQRQCKLALPPASDEPLDDERLVRRLSESVYIVGTLYKGADSDEFDVSLATAFAVTADGVLCTSFHVFDDDPEALVSLAMDSRGQTFPIEQILAANEASDTCLLRVRATGLKPLPLGRDAMPGSRVRIMSHPGDSFFYFSSGQVNNYETDDDGVIWMNVSADFGQGSSGGPVVDSCGNVIGQVSRTATMYAGDPLELAEDKPLAHSPTPRHHHRRASSVDVPFIPDIPAWLEPQMVFRSCVPTMHLKELVETP